MSGARRSGFHALADPNRRVIVERLSGGPAMLQHLQVLETSGVVRSEKVGRVRTCRIEPAALRPVERWIGAQRTNWERLDHLGEYLAEGNDEPTEENKR
jgi:DNA-binding transcriptional ArsR family regulator